MITPVYASLLAMLFVYLSVRTIGLRRSLRIGLGHAENPLMLRAMRVHANFAEYVPLALVLVFFVESSSAPPLLVHALGAALLIGRVSHAFGVSREPEQFAYRIFGMAMTFSVLSLSALYVLVAAVMQRLG